MEEENLKEKKGSILKIFKRKEIIISGLVGIVLGAALLFVLQIIGVPGLGNEVVVTMKTGRITENNLYTEMKKYYPISYILELVDKSILNKKYDLSDEQKEEITAEADNYINTYETYYGYTEEEFLEQNGFESKEEFEEYLSLDYKRNLYYLDYLKTIISEDKIKEYYENNVYGEIDTKHMLVEITDDVTEKEALKLAKEIIKKLNSGKEFDKVAEEYEDKIIFEELGYNGIDSGLVAEYVEASKKLENGTYSKEPVKTDYGYHIIYKIDQKEKPSMEDAKNDIVGILGEDLEAEDQYIRYKALIKLREENKVKFRNNDYKKQYEEYCEEVNQ